MISDCWLLLTVQTISCTNMIFDIADGRSRLLQTRRASGCHRRHHLQTVSGWNHAGTRRLRKVGQQLLWPHAGTFERQLSPVSKVFVPLLSVNVCSSLHDMLFRTKYFVCLHLSTYLGGVNMLSAATYYQWRVVRWGSASPVFLKIKDDYNKKIKL